MKKLLILFLSVLFISFSCNTSNSTSKKDENTDVKLENAQKNLDSVKKATFRWKYDTVVNEMDDSKRSFALLISYESKEFKYPYNGGTRTALVIVKKGKEKFATYMIENGQFSTSAKRIRIRIDDNDPVLFNYSMDVPGNNSQISIKEPDKFIDLIKEADSLKIESEFYGNGVEIFKFNSKGFDYKKL